jgi:hypothetical protein
MTIQMAAVSDDIFKSLLRDKEDIINYLWKMEGKVDTAADRINNKKNSVVGKINVEIAKVSKNNDDHVDEVMDYTTNTIVNEIKDIDRHFEDELLDNQSLIIEANKNNTQLILIEQCNNFSKALNLIDDGMNRVMIEAKNKDIGVMLKA